MEFPWQKVGDFAPESLTDARLQLHHGALVLASIADSFLDTLPDDSPSNFGFDPALVSFSTHPLVAGSDLAAHLRIESMTLEFRTAAGASAALELAGRTIAYALEWVRGVAAKNTGGDVRIVQRQFADFPASPIMDGAAFAQPDQRQAEIARYFADAQWVMQELVADNPKMSPIRTWPHHFDIGAVIPLQTSGEDVVSIGLGMSPGDQFYDQPYYYCSPYPRPEPVGLPALIHGHWRTEDFVSAILTATEMLHGGEDQRATTESYIERAVTACATILGR